MTHDPMHTGALGDGDGCRVCEIIARVREDERDKCEANGPYFTSVVHECCERVQTERAAALDAARESADVALLGTLQSTRDRVLSAIDALRGES